MENLYDKIKKVEPDLTFCDWKECKNRGQYIRCYFDLSILCPLYITHKNYLNTVKKMRENRKYQPRHHPRKR